MILLNDAIRIIDEIKVSAPVETIYFIKALNRVLAEDIYSPEDVPSFNKSSMDGYALMNADSDKKLKIINSIKAGDNVNISLKSCECVKIMTGAKIPSNADLVIKVEDVNWSDNIKVSFKRLNSESNIIFKGDIIKKSEKLLSKGEAIKPGTIGLLAGLGHVNTLVYKTVAIAVISTGNELIEPHEIQNEANIRNSNSYQIVAQCERLGITASYQGIASDNKEDLIDKFETALKFNGLLILSGGVSAGEYDFVLDALKELGFTIIFHKLKIRPGKPVLFAGKENKFVFGLPGNPVSSFFQFELLVKPLIYKMMGHHYKPVVSSHIFAADFKRKEASLDLIVPVSFNNDNEALPVKYLGSSHISVLTSASGYTILPIGKTEIKKGEIVNCFMV